jgi:hypothetical protein
MTSSDFWAAFATMIALGSAAFTVYISRRQLRIQNLEKYLSAALYVAWDCYKAANIFIATWTHNKDDAKNALAGQKLSEDQKRARQNFELAWRKFDSDLTASRSVIEAAGTDYDLVRDLKRLHDTSAALYDKLIDEKIKLESIADFEVLPQAIAAREAAASAAKSLAVRLNRLYKV